MFIELTRVIKGLPEKKVILNVDKIISFVSVNHENYDGTSTQIELDGNITINCKETYDEVKNIIVSVLEVKYNNDNICI